MVREGKTIPPDPAAENTAVAQYLLRWAPQYKQWEFASDREKLSHRLDLAEAAAAETHSELARRLAELGQTTLELKETRAELTAAQATHRDLETELAKSRSARRLKEAELAESRSLHKLEVEQALRKSDAKEIELIGQINSLTAQRGHWRNSHDEISQSATWRLAQSVLQSWLLRSAAAPMVERLGAYLRRTLPDKHR